MQWLLDELLKQGAVVKQAPLIFLFVWAAGLAALYLLLRWFFQDRLKAKDDLIGSLKEKLALPTQSLVKGSEKWLEDIAEKDKLELHNVVYVTECTVNESLTGNDPHVMFRFFIRNGAVHSISISPNIKGFISLNNQRLLGQITASSLPHNLQHGWGDRFQIRQELNAEDIAEIGTLDAASEGQGVYDFGHLHITVRANSSTTDTLPARLQFKRVTRRLINNAFELV